MLLCRRSISTSWTQQKSQDFGERIFALFAKPHSPEEKVATLATDTISGRITDILSPVPLVHSYLNDSTG
jgi:hypothetical protein